MSVVKFWPVGCTVYQSNTVFNQILYSNDVMLGLSIMIYHTHADAL